MKKHAYYITFILLVGPVTLAHGQSLVAPGAQVQKLHGDFSFTEGPAADSDGNVFFTDIPNNRIMVSLTTGYVTTFNADSQSTGLPGRRSKTGLL